MSNAPRRLLLPREVPILVPNGSASMTAFVLEEQQDWFEGELPFLRNLVRPGWTCVDVGASYGSYALSLAASAGPQGRVIAIEPHPEVNRLLSASAALATGSAPIAVHGSALSDHEGRARLSDPKDPELAELDKDGRFEVETATLDGVLAGRRPDVIKIDVEGHGFHVLDGARRCLGEASPVVQFVLQHGGSVEVRSTDLLMRSGYMIYRLLPGLGVLSPLVPGEPIDGFGLNAFAIKPDREAELRERGVLVGVMQERELAIEGVRVQEILDRLAGEPWIAPWRPQWMPNAIQPGWDAQRRAVSLAACAFRETWPAERRVAAMRLAFSAVREALAQAITGSRLFTAARIANSLGLRSDARSCLDQLIAAITAKDAAVGDTFREPFLLPLPEHESLTYPTFPEMLLGAALEAMAFISSYSAYFNPPGKNQLFERIAALPTRCPRSDRTLKLLAARTSVRPVIRF